MKLKENQKLTGFVNKILNYNDILIDDTRYLFLGSIISADSMMTKEDCEEIIELATFIKNNIELFVLEPEQKEETLKYMYSAIELANNELKELNNKK